MKAGFTADREDKVKQTGLIYKSSHSEMLTIPLVFEELVGGFLLGPLPLQQREQPLLLLTGAIHEVIPWLKHNK